MWDDLTDDIRIPTDRIVRDPAIQGGKPIVKGTRIPVELVLGHLVGNPDLDDLFAAYPHLTVGDVQAVFAYAREAVLNEHEHRHQQAASAPAASIG
jgi:uncharacterized protein (DUF433 family)